MFRTVGFPLPQNPLNQHFFKKHHMVGSAHFLTSYDVGWVESLNPVCVALSLLCFLTLFFSFFKSRVSEMFNLIGKPRFYQKKKKKQVNLVFQSAGTRNDLGPVFDRGLKSSLMNKFACSLTLGGFYFKSKLNY